MRGFCDPGGVGVPSILFNKDVVVAWEDVSCRDDVHMNEALQLVLFRDGVVFALHFLSKPLNVFYHQVFLAELVGVGKVIHNLVFV